MRKYILTVTLNPAVDKTAKVRNFSLAKEFRTKDIYLSAGGKGINVSQVLKKLEIKTKATGFQGGMAGGFIIDQLNKEGIRNDFIKVDGETRTSLTVLDPETKKITRILELGPQISPAEFRRFKKKFAVLLNQSCCAVFSGRNAFGLPDSAYAQLIKMAKKKRVITVLDTSGPALKEGLKAKPFLIKPNEEETKEVLNIDVQSIQDVKRSIEHFHRWGIPLVIISRGAKGAVFSNGREQWMAVPPRIKFQNPVGCGDALIAGFLAAFLRGRDLKGWAQEAIAVSAANALSINPGSIRKGDVRKIRARVTIRAI